MQKQRAYLTNTNFRNSESMLHILFSAELRKMSLIIFEAYTNVTLRDMKRIFKRFVLKDNVKMQVSLSH